MSVGGKRVSRNNFLADIKRRAAPTPIGVNSRCQWHCSAPVGSRTGSWMYPAASASITAVCQSLTLASRPPSARRRSIPAARSGTVIRWRKATCSSTSSSGDASGSMLMLAYHPRLTTRGGSRPRPSADSPRSGRCFHQIPPSTADGCRDLQSTLFDSSGHARMANPARGQTAGRSRLSMQIRIIGHCRQDLLREADHSIGIWLVRCFASPTRRGGRAPDCLPRLPRRRNCRRPRSEFAPAGCRLWGERVMRSGQQRKRGLPAVPARRRRSR
jgi:hypothetical protein